MLADLHERTWSPRECHWELTILCKFLLKSMLSTPSRFGYFRLYITLKIPTLILENISHKFGKYRQIIGNNIIFSFLVCVNFGTGACLPKVKKNSCPVALGKYRSRSQTTTIDDAVTICVHLKQIHKDPSVNKHNISMKMDGTMPPSKYRM